MGNLRKDHVSERFVIVNPPKIKYPKTKKNPFKSGNESLTNPSVLSLVLKDGMLQRLQDDENQRKNLGWDIKRNLAKINYKIHTEAIKQNLIPKQITKNQTMQIYASEADILNLALFGLTAKDWREKNNQKQGNIRDYANVTQLVCLSNLENLNAEFIRQEISQPERLIKLNKIAISQMKLLIGHKSIKKLK